MQIPRKHRLRRVRLLLNEFPVVALLGARQVGKSTLARQLTASHRDRTTWFDLENPADLARLADPGLELRPLRGLVVLDEIQRLPDVFPLLRVLADRPRTPARFLVLGSASPEQCFHWSTHSGAKLDLLLVTGNRRSASRSSAPKRRDRPLPCARPSRPWASTASMSCIPEPRATRWPRESEPCLPSASPRSCDRSRSERHVRVLAAARDLVCPSDGCWVSSYRS